MQKVFIADHCEDFSVVLTGALRARFQVEVCPDGTRALELIRASRPDVLILDLMLPGTPGMDILRAVREEQLCAAVIITSRFFSDYVLESLQRLHVDYAVRKPCAMQSIIDRVEELCAGINPTQTHQPDPHCAVSSILLSLGMPTNRKGFRYCRQAVLMMADDPSAQVTKEIYPTIGKQCGTSKTAVEKAIRSAIDTAWENRNNDLWRQYFVPAPNGQVPRPTNAQFLTRIADAIAMGQRAAKVR